MGERETDKLLADLFKGNAPSVNEQALSERITARLRPRRRKRRRNRIARAVALGFASIVLVGAAALGAYTAVDHFQRQPRLVFTDLNRGPGGPLLARVSPVMGTAVLEQVKNEGTSDPGNAADGIHRVRDRVEVYRLSMSQPLVTGTMEIRSNLATRPDGSTDIEGSWVLHTDQGVWECPSWKGSLTANDSEQFYFGNASGAGGLEGLTLLLQWHVAKNRGSSAIGAESSEPIAVSGWIQSTK